MQTVDETITIPTQKFVEGDEVFFDIPAADGTCQPWGCYSILTTVTEAWYDFQENEWKYRLKNVVGTFVRESRLVLCE